MIEVIDLWKAFGDNQVLKGLDLRIERVILLCLDKEPEQRYATAKALADDLDRVLKDRMSDEAGRGEIRAVGRRVRDEISREYGAAAGAIRAAEGVGSGQRQGAADQRHDATGATHRTGNGYRGVAVALGR